MTNLKDQKCLNCRFSRSNESTQSDAMLSCRYNPPLPGSLDNSWRVVPNDFWCGKWERGGLWENNVFKPVAWRSDD